MKKAKQYTIRGVSEGIDKHLRQVALKQGMSLNAWVLEILRRYTDLQHDQALYHDLDSLAGKWVEDEETLKALAEQDQIDKELWK